MGIVAWQMEFFLRFAVFFMILIRVVRYRCCPVLFLQKKFLFFNRKNADEMMVVWKKFSTFVQSILERNL